MLEFPTGEYQDQVACI